MPVPQVILSGEARTGIIVSPEHREAIAHLPLVVALGRNAPHRPAKLANVPRLQDVLDLNKYTPPEEVDWYTAAAASIAHMMRNDVHGCCVISGKGHDLGVWSANDPDSGGIVIPTDAEIDQQYSGVCGPGDNGCVITDVLDYMVRSGFTAQGKKYKIDGYVSVDWTSKELTKAALAIFGAGCIGINLPSAWTSAAVWDVTTTGIVGGHDVSPAGYGKPRVITTTKEGVVVASWGRLYLITWEAWVRRSWLEEFYVMLPSFLWTGTDRKAPSGFDYDGLKASMAALHGGSMPDDPTPTPVPPPVPPPTPDPVPVLPKNFGVSCGVGTPWTKDATGRYVSSGTFSVSVTKLAGEPLPDLEPFMTNITVPTQPVEFFGAKLPGVHVPAFQVTFGDGEANAPSDWLLAVLKQICAFGPQLPEPLNHAVAVLCWFVNRPQAARLEALPPILITALKLLCQYAYLIPAPYGTFLSFICRFFPTQAKKTGPCGGC